MKENNPLTLIKIPVETEVRFGRDGKKRLTAIIWKDGTRYPIKNILHACPSYDHEYEGVRYAVIIGSAQKYIYRNGTRWYVMAKDRGKNS